MEKEGVGEHSLNTFLKSHSSSSPASHQKDHWLFLNCMTSEVGPEFFFAMIMMMTDTGPLCTLYKSSVLIDTWQPKGHILARRGHHHVLGVELYASDGSGMVSIEYADFGAIFRIPNVDSAIGGPRDNKLTVGAKRGLQWDRFSVEMTSEGLEYCPGESVDQLDHASIGGNQNGFAVRTELEAGPIDILFCWFAC